MPLEDFSEESPFTDPPTRVVVIGGGIAGLTAAWELMKTPNVTVRVLEATSRFGGKLHTTEFAGKEVETGADAFLARVPDAVNLCAELGILDQLISPAKGNAMLWSRGALHPFPRTTVLGIPSDIDDVERSGIISPEGISRAREEIDLRNTVGRDELDISIGQLVSARFGDEIKERLVDPLVGGINAGNVDELGLASAAPQILNLTRANESLTVSARDQLAERAAEVDPRPVFYTPAGGLQVLIDALVTQLRDKGAALHTYSGVNALVRRDDQWIITTDNDVLTADAVIMATPANRTSALLNDSAPLVSDLLRTIRYASVAVVRMAYKIGDIGVSMDASGFVVPAVEQRLVTACSWVSSKWSVNASEDLVILRASVGRLRDDRAWQLDDDSLIESTHEELAEMMQISGLPLEADVVRWPEAFPQYEPGHAARVEMIESAAANVPNLALAGAAYDGLGIPSCVRSGTKAAHRIVSLIHI